MIEPASRGTYDQADRFALRARLALAVLVVIAALVDLFLWRRTAGRWLPPETPWLAFAAAACVGTAQGAAWCAFARNALRTSHPVAAWLARRPRLAAGLGALVVAGPAGLAGLALFPAAGEFAAGGLATIVVLLGAGTWCLTAELEAERAVWRESLPPLATRTLAADDARASRTELAGGTPIGDEARNEEGADDEPEGFNDEGLLQEVRRTRWPDGTQALDATLAAEFPAGARNVSLHLPIWPLLPGELDVTAEPVDADGDEVRVAVGMVRSFGIRLDVRRTGGIEDPARVVICVALRTCPAVSVPTTVE